MEKENAIEGCYVQATPATKAREQRAQLAKEIGWKKARYHLKPAEERGRREYLRELKRQHRKALKKQRRK
tara:strand:- start:231 stop:440 length:210 start_codon:yes stop_codon:yes gene_type:complete